MVQANDTIAAIATALSPAGIGIVRISGPEAVTVASRVFVPAGKNASADREYLSKAASHTVHYGTITEGDRVIDEVILLLMRGPRSYTREDTVEIDCHGGVLVTRRVLAAVLAAGARLAEPGEFTKRAYLNGRIDLSQAEAVAGVISAKSDLALRNSVRQLRGRVRDEITAIRSGLLREIAQIEATLDDPEHLSFDGFDEKMNRELADHSARIRRLIETADDGRLIREGIRTVIVGKPNAGKSSMLNALLGEERAIVTDIAGTTRDTLTEEVRLQGVTLLLVDTAGIRETDDAIEQIGVERARAAATEADLILVVIDGSEPLTADDREILKTSCDRPMIVLLNKSDLASAVSEEELRAVLREEIGSGEKPVSNGSGDTHVSAGSDDTSASADSGDTLASTGADIGEDPVILSVSAKTEEGLRELEETILHMFFSQQIEADSECVITSERHKQALIAAEESLARVRESIDCGMSEDFYTIDLTAAYEALGTILGEETDEDVINAVFSEFCLGK